MKMYLVLNAAAEEGCIFSDEDDAMHAAKVMRNNPVSTLADAMADIYCEEDDVLKIIEIDVPDEAVQASDLEPPKMSLEYPEDMPPALADALSLMNFQTGPIAHIYRAAGHNIPTKCEAEQAFVLHRCIKLALTHGEDWRKHAQAEINDIKARLKPSDPKIEDQNG